MTLPASSQRAAKASRRLDNQYPTNYKSPPSPIESPLFELAGAALPKAHLPKRTRQKAIVIRRGSVTVRICGKAPRLRVCWYGTNEKTGQFGRLRRRFADRAEAERFAEEKAIALANGELWRTSIEQTDIASYKRALEIIAPTGKSIELAAAEFAEAYLILQKAGLAETIADAARYLARNRPIAGARKTCPQILVEMLLVRQRDGAFKNTLDDYRSRLGRFCKYFQGPILETRGKDINQWLRTLTRINKFGDELVPKQYITKRTRNNYRDAIREFYRFAREMEYVPKDWAAFADVVRVKNEPVVVKIYTPEEMQKFLGAALDNLVPAMATLAFGTVRSEEVCPDDPALPRLDWREFNFETREIHVMPEVARKIGEDRIIPMSDNLAAWLEPYRKPNGPICELSNLPNALARTAARAGIKLLDNGLRRSSISYRLAVTHNIEKTAKEGGTSPERIRLNYKVTIPEREGKRWYRIVPGMPPNVEQLPLGLPGLDDCPQTVPIQSAPCVLAK